MTKAERDALRTLANNATVPSWLIRIEMHKLLDYVDELEAKLDNLILNPEDSQRLIDDLKNQCSNEEMERRVKAAQKHFKEVLVKREVGK